MITLLAHDGGARDGDALALAAGEVGDGGVGVLDGDSEVGEGLLGRDLHRTLVEHTELAEQPGLEQLPAHVDVGGAVEVGRERKVLVDGLDPELLRGRRRTDINRSALEQQLAAVGADDAGDDLRQRALAGAVVADHRDDLTGIDGEARALQRVHVSVGLDDVARLEDRRAAGVSRHGAPPQSCGRRRQAADRLTADLTTLSCQR